MHYKQELQNAPTQADKNYGSYSYIVVVLHTLYGRGSIKAGQLGRRSGGLGEL